MSPFLLREHPLLCEPYAKQYLASHPWRERKADVPLPVAVQVFAHDVDSTNLASYFESLGKQVNMKGQTVFITQD